MAESIGFVPAGTGTSSDRDEVKESTGCGTVCEGDQGASIAGERGSSLVAVMAVMTAVLLIGTALFFFGVSENDLASFQSEDVRAFYLAEAGVARAIAYLDTKLENDEYVPTKTFANQALGDGTYTVEMQTVAGSSLWNVEYDVVSTGTVNGVSRRVHVTLGMETFAKYLWLIEQTGGGAIEWFTTDDILDGAVHGNTRIRINGDPYFGGLVTTTESSFVMRPGSSPVFALGYEFGVEEEDLPNRNQYRNFIRATAHHGGIYLGNLNGSDAHWEIVFGRNGIAGTVSYRYYRKQGHHYQYGNWVDEDLSSLNGAIYSKKAIWIEGTVDGEVSIFCQDKIHIRDDLVYEDSTPGLGPNVGCDDLLGIYSRTDIIVDRTAANQSDCEIHAALIAFHFSFEIEDPNSGPPRGDLIVYGSIVQERPGTVSTFNTPGALTHGYHRKYYYDIRLKSDYPPYYPQIGSPIVTRWEEVPVS